MKRSLIRCASLVGTFRCDASQRCIASSLKTSSTPFFKNQLNLTQSRRLHLSTVRNCVHNNQKDDKPVQKDDVSSQFPIPNNFSNLPDYVRNHVFLSDLPLHFLSNFWKSMRNRVFEFMIRGYFDPEFSMAGFISGATQAVVKISHILADGDLKTLESMDVLSPDALAEVKENIAKMSLQQRLFLRISPEDIFRKFVYEIGVIMDDNTDERYVEILFIVHGQHGYGTMNTNLKTAESSEEIQSASSIFTNAMRPFGRDEFVCNYRFIRQFRSPAVASTNVSHWIVNKLNHFRPIHYVLKHHFEQTSKN